MGRIWGTSGNVLLQQKNDASLSYAVGQTYLADDDAAWLLPQNEDLFDIRSIDLFDAEVMSFLPTNDSLLDMGGGYRFGAVESSVASIIPALPGPWPTTPTTSTPIAVSSSYTVSSGTVIYANGLPTITAGQASLFTMSSNGGELINNGEVWVRDSQAVGFRWGANGATVRNNGLVVVESTGGNAYGIYDSYDLGPSGGILHNTGQLYVFGHGYAWGMTGRSAGPATYINDGLIAVFSATGTATGFEYGNLFGPTARNGAAGRIVVEGVSAIGVDIHHNNIFTNQGSITANTIANPVTGLVENYSIGIASYIFPAGIGRFVEINNSGTITADIAVVGYSITGYSGLGNHMVVNNLSGGILNGMVWFEFTNDVLNNSGTINGSVDMREGADTLDTTAGAINGLIDMGFGNDVFRGSAGNDTVLGNRNDDELYGAGGDDLLLGGSGRDLLEGGLGNDGLYGEAEDDVIITLGGDVVSGGDGNDRIELGDYSFRAIDGGAGIDTLVLATGARVVDWHAVVASGRVTGIEAVTLRGDQQLVLSAADLTGLSGGHFIVNSTASDTLSLIGAWSESAATLVGGVNYRTFDLGGTHVLVAGGGTVLANATMPGNATGLDAIAAGAIPRLPGSMPGADLSSNIWVARDYELGGDFVIDASEIWTNDITTPFGIRANIFSIYDSIDFTNNGAIIAEVVGSYRMVDIGFLTSLTNNGYLGLTQTGAGPGQSNLGVVEAIAIQQHGTVLNTGTIDVEAVGTVYAVSSFGGDGRIIVNPVETIIIPAFENRGNVSVISYGSSAVGVSLANGSTVINSGTLSVIGGSSGGFATAATGISMNYKFQSLVNSGTISASVAPGGEGGMFGSIGVRVSSVVGTNPLYVPTITNSGVIEATNAIQVVGEQAFSMGTFVINNSNRITGNVTLIGLHDTINNSGLIDGTISLGAGNDSYNGSAGTVTGIVYGGDGNDTLTGGSAADWFEGGAGDDILSGGGGADRALYTEATSAINVDLRIAAAQNTSGAGIDTLTDIEGLVGSSYGDMLTGNDEANYLDGGGSNDIITGYGGNDTINGGTGQSDEVRYAGNQADYLVEEFRQGDQRYFRVTGLGAFAGDGVDILTNVEYLQFANARVGLANNRPQIGPNPIPNISAGDGVVFTYQIPAGAFFDPDAGDVLRYRATLSNGNPLPAWLTFNPLTRTFTGAPPVSGLGQTFALRVYASDQDGIDPDRYVFDDFVLTITESPGPDIIGTFKNETLDGTFRADRIYGMGGNDILNGLGGVDEIYGGDGDDIFLVTAASEIQPGEILDGGAGFDTLQFVAGGTLDLSAATITSIEAMQIGFVKLTLAQLDSFQRIDATTVQLTTGGAISFAGVDILRATQFRITSGATTLDLSDAIVASGKFVTVETYNSWAVTLIGNSVAGTGLYANAGNDTLVGGAGNDDLFGSGGIDRVLYSRATAGVTVDLRITTAQNTIGAGSDRLNSIEELVGSSFGDTLIGNNEANFLDGGDGDDTITGWGGNDTIDGGAGTNDEVRYAGNRADYSVENVIMGGVRQVRITGLGAFASDGVDILTNVEFVQFADVRVNITNSRPIIGQTPMADQSAGDGLLYSYQVPLAAFHDADPDDIVTFRATLSNGASLPSWLTFNPSTRTFSGTPPLEAVGSVLQIRVYASDDDINDPDYEVFDDFALTITLAPGADVNGTPGPDALSGTFRPENMIGLDGDDIFYGSGGADTLNGGAGFDIANYAASAAAIAVDLTSGANSGGDAQGDVLLSIEGVVGSNFDDNIGGTGDQDYLWGGNGADTLRGYVGDDYLFGEAGNDIIYGNSGNDVIDGGDGVNDLRGGSGNDRLIVGSGASGTSVDGGADIDTLVVAGPISLGALVSIEAIEFQGGANLTLTGSQFSNGLASNSFLSGAGILTVNMDVPGIFISKLLTFVGSGVSLVVNGTSGADTFKLGNGGHTVNAGDGTDQIKGGDLADTINGGAGIDKINGAAGADILTGGLGNDVFKYAKVTDSGLGVNADRITDFVIGSDRLNFVKIDANAGLAGDQAFAFVGTGAFTGGGAGSIRYQASGGDLLVQVDVDGNGTADMEIILQGLGAQTLTGGDFVL